MLKPLEKPLTVEEVDEVISKIKPKDTKPVEKVSDENIDEKMKLALKETEELLNKL